MSEILQAPSVAPAQENPLLNAWQTPHQTPPFTEILPEHFIPAFEQAFVDHAAEITAISHDPAESVWVEDVAKAIECGLQLLDRLALPPAIQTRTDRA